MRILLVEDNVEFSRTVEKAVSRIPHCELIWVASRDSALAALNGESYDLVILDRRIPTADNVLDDHSDHGWLVFQKVLESRPGTPIWFLTGNEDADFAADFLNDYGRSEDIFGTRHKTQMYRVFWKKKVNECLALIRDFTENCVALDRIAVTVDGELPNFRHEEGRVVKVYGRIHNGSSVEISSVGGGLSGARVLRVGVRDADSKLITVAVAKVAHVDAIFDEANRYRTDISRLGAGGFPSLTEQIHTGAGAYGGLFYSVVGEKVENLFDRLASGTVGVESNPAMLRAIEASWYASKKGDRVSVGSVRRHFIGDVDMRNVKEHLPEVDFSAVESREIAVNNCCQHRDLHCANVVFDQRGHPMLIDFGDAGPSYSCVDPVTLELSTVFHLQRYKLQKGWPSIELLKEWPVGGRYLLECPNAPFVTACRDWAKSEAASADEVVAVGFGYGIRQLRYPDTDKELARELIKSCAAALMT